eukprot:6689048-Prymnesium_polylepis.1
MRRSLTFDASPARSGGARRAARPYAGGERGRCALLPLPVDVAALARRPRAHVPHAAALANRDPQVVTTWLVPSGAREGVDYDLKTLTEVCARRPNQERPVGRGGGLQES